MRNSASAPLRGSVSAVFQSKRRGGGVPLRRILPRGPFPERYGSPSSEIDITLSIQSHPRQQPSSPGLLSHSGLTVTPPTATSFRLPDSTGNEGVSSGREITTENIPRKRRGRALTRWSSPGESDPRKMLSRGGGRRVVRIDDACLTQT